MSATTGFALFFLLLAYALTMAIALKLGEPIVLWLMRITGIAKKDTPSARPEPLDSRLKKLLVMILLSGLVFVVTFISLFVYVNQRSPATLQAQGSQALDQAVPAETANPAGLDDMDGPGDLADLSDLEDLPERVAAPGQTTNTLSTLSWALTPLFSFQGMVLLLTSYLVFGGACLTVGLSNSRSVLAAYSLFLPLPFLLGLFGMAHSSIESMIVCIESEGFRLIEFVAGFAGSLYPLITGIVTSLPASVVVAIGLRRRVQPVAPTATHHAPAEPKPSMPTPPQRRPLQFRLRTLMIAVTLFAILFAWAKPIVEQVLEPHSIPSTRLPLYLDMLRQFPLSGSLLLLTGLLTLIVRLARRASSPASQATSSPTLFSSRSRSSWASWWAAATTWQS